MMNEQKTEESAEEIIQDYQPQLKGFIRKRVSSNEDAEDILQDVFYKLLKTIQDTLNPIENMTAWLYRVTRNTIINKGKKKRESLFPEQEDGSDEPFMNELSEVMFNENNATPETEYLQSLVWEELDQALAALPKEQREVFELTEFEDISVKDISEETGVSVNTLLSRKHYAVKKLRRSLKEIYEDILFE
jgi:RNA polymerase sigma factor (sigma-70 family)